MPSTTRRRTTLGLPLCLFVFVCALLVALGARAATFYVDDDAANNNGDGLSAATAKHNITAALALCNPAGGDTVVILDGTYADPADQITLASLPANATSYTTLKAQNRWKVQIFQALACSQDSAARNYVALDGLRFLALGSHEFAGAHWKIQNCAFYGALDIGNNGSSTNGAPTPGRACTDILIEDCHVWGPGSQNFLRYKVLVYNSSNVIVRRVVSRHDGGYTSVGVQNPSAVFMVYSSQSVRLQNCIAIDSPGQANDFWSAGYYTADHQSNGQLLWKDVRWEGCIAMSIQDAIGYWIDNGGNSGGVTTFFDNCLVLGGYGDGGFAAWNNNSPNVGLVFNQCSVLSTSPATSHTTGIFEGGYNSTVKNCIVLNQSQDGIGSADSITFNDTFGNGSNSPGTGGVTTDPRLNGLLYPVRIEAGSSLLTAGGGTRIGADISKSWGTSGSMWGQTGYDTVSSGALWPFPNEDQIKADFRLMDNGSDEKRGFCADGTTLTRYIWEYLGNAVPAGLYSASPADTQVPSAPGNLHTAAVFSNQIDLAWNASTDNVGVTGYRVFRNGTQIGTTAGLTFSDTGLAPATPYTYAVSAVDAAGNVSALSSTLPATTLAVTAPTPSVAALSGVATNKSAIVISGSNFGASAATQQIYDDVETGALNTNWTKKGNLVISSASQRHARSKYSGYLNFVDGAWQTNDSAMVSGGTDSKKWTVSYWFRLSPTWEWGTGAYGQPGAKLSNVKFFRMWSTASTMENMVCAFAGYSGGSVIGTVENIGSQTWYFWGYNNITKGEWHNITCLYDDSSSLGAADGKLKMYYDNKEIFNRTNLVTRLKETQFKRPAVVGFWNSWQENDGHKDEIWLDDMYIRNSWQRVVLGDAPTYGACTRFELQPITSWSDNSVSIALNQGSFNNGETAYLYVVNDQDVPSAGKPITFGGTTADTQPPSTPSGLRAMAASASQIDLAWNPSTDDRGVVGYKVYLGSALLGATSATSYSHTGLAAGQSYTYSVTALDAAGNESAHSASASASTVGPPDPNGGLVGYWKFDETKGTTAADSSKTPAAGSLKNVNLKTVWVLGKSGNAVDLDGLNDFIDLGDPTKLRLTGATTVSAWINPRSLAHSGCIYSQGDGAGKYGPSLNIENSGKIAFSIASSANSQVSVSAVASAGQWVHVAGVYEPGVAVRLYVNGVLAAETTVGVPPKQYLPGSHVNIGRRPDGLAASYFDGKIDEMRVYNRALKGADVQALFSR